MPYLFAVYKGPSMNPVLPESSFQFSRKLFMNFLTLKPQMASRYTSLSKFYFFSQEDSTKSTVEWARHPDLLHIFVPALKVSK